MIKLINSKIGKLAIFTHQVVYFELSQWDFEAQKDNFPLVIFLQQR